MFSISKSRFHASRMAIPHRMRDGIRSNMPTSAADLYSAAFKIRRSLSLAHNCSMEENSSEFGDEKYASSDVIWTFVGNPGILASSRAQTNKNCSSGSWEAY